MHPMNLDIPLNTLVNAGIEPKEGTKIVLQSESKIVGAKVIYVDFERNNVKVRTEVD